MLGIIAYGSLINQQETKYQQKQPMRTIPIKLRTFKRSFNQLPAWRDNTTVNSAVLNVQESGQNWLNGVCFCYAEFDFTALDNRERGYIRTVVDSDKISSYQGYNLPELEEIYIYQGKIEHQSNVLMPNPDYLNICLTGAKHWGEEFYCSFLDTTHINNGILLREYLQST